MDATFTLFAVDTHSIPAFMPADDPGAVSPDAEPARPATGRDRNRRAYDAATAVLAAADRPLRTSEVARAIGMADASGISTVSAALKRLASEGKAENYRESDRSYWSRPGVSPVPTRGECPTYTYPGSGPQPTFLNEILWTLWDQGRPMRGAEIAVATNRPGAAGRSQVSDAMRRLERNGYVVASGKPSGKRYTIAPRDRWGVPSQDKKPSLPRKGEVVALLSEVSALKSKLANLVEAMGASR